MILPDREEARLAGVFEPLPCVWTGRRTRFDERDPDTIPVLRRLLVAAGGVGDREAPREDAGVDRREPRELGVSDRRWSTLLPDLEGFFLACRGLSDASSSSSTAKAFVVFERRRELRPVMMLSKFQPRFTKYCPDAFCCVSGQHSPVQLRHNKQLQLSSLLATTEFKRLLALLLLLL